MKLIENLENLKKADNGIYYSVQNQAVSYPEDGNQKCLQIEENSFWFKHRNNIITEAVRKFSPGELFFDIGGGNGYVSKGLQDHGVETILVEPGMQGAVNAKYRGLDYVICSTLEDTGFLPNTLPTVGLFDVVEHIEGDVKFLANVNKFLCHGGLLYMTVPAFNTLWSNEDVDAGHFRRYTLNQIKETCKMVGFEILYATYFFSILPIPIYIQRTLPSKLGLNQNSSELTKHQNEHNQKEGIVGSLLKKIWDWELNMVKSGKSIKIGSSCFIVGKKL